jgi:hypothetical protein
MEEIIYCYVAEVNPQGAYLPGVPLRDLTQADVDGMPAWLRPSLAACGFYERVALGESETRAAAQPQRKAKEK